jgi:sarcosine oxidase gamma subunit
VGRGRRGGFRLDRLVVVTLAALTVVITGCATVPVGTAPRSLEGQSGQQQAFVQPLPPPAPTSAWNPEEVVLGFLAASASFELDPAAAEAYLAPGTPWRHSASVTVVGTSLEYKEPNISRLTAAISASVTVSGHVLASLSSLGQYSYKQGATSWPFKLYKVGSIWRIQNPPPFLLLTQTTFEQVFQPRNLYFLGGPDGSDRYLVPDPVFAPLQGRTNANVTDLATELVNGLLHDKDSWLAHGTRTAFPKGTTCKSCVDVSNQTVVVNLGGRAATASQADLGRMYAQLRETLASPSYDLPAVAQHVVLKIDGTVRRVRPSAILPQFGALGGTLYYAGAGLVSKFAPGSRPAKVPLPVPLAGEPDVTAIATSYGTSELAVAVPNGRGCAVYVVNAGKTTGYSTYRLSGTGGSCTSLSFDQAQNLWAVAGSRIWVLRPHQRAEQVSPMPTASGVLPAGSRVMSLRIAPDGVRAVLLVRTPTTTGPKYRNVLLLAAAGEESGVTTLTVGPPVGTDLGSVTAVSWYSPDELLVLNGSTELYEVPLTGGKSSLVATLSTKAVDLSTAGDDGAIAIGTANGKVYLSPGLDQGWTEVRSGPAPVQAGPAYPG